MTRKQWFALRPGDVVLQRRSRTPRVVLQVSDLYRAPFDASGHPRRRYISLLKLTGSRGDPCTWTTFLYTDAKFRLRTTRQRVRLSPAAARCPVHPEHSLDLLDQPR